MDFIKREDEEERKGILPRYQILKNLEFVSGKNLKEMDEDENVICVSFIKKDSGKIVKKYNIKFKYLKEALEFFNKPIKTNDMRSFLTPLANKALEIQLFCEDDKTRLLHELSYRGKLDLVKKLVNERSPDINSVVESGWTPLLHAVANGHFKVASYLLQKSANPNIENKMGATPILYSSFYGNKNLCNLLIKYGADVNHQDMEGRTALMRAAIRGHGSIIKILLANGANPQIVDHHNMTALSYAEEHKYGDIAQILRNAMK
jgi:ankyrin repeat protein